MKVKEQEQKLETVKFSSLIPGEVGVVNSGKSKGHLHLRITDFEYKSGSTIIGVCLTCSKLVDDSRDVIVVDAETSFAIR